jgi:hypothetical protein
MWDYHMFIPQHVAKRGFRFCTRIEPLVAIGQIKELES